MHASHPGGQQAWMLTIVHTQIVGLGINIMVNVAVNPTILLCCRSQIAKNIADR